MLPHDDRNPFQQNPWKRFTNASGETIPPFSVMRITGSTNNNGEITFTVAKPNATDYDYYLVNGPWAVPAAKDGLCTTLKQAGYVAYNSCCGTPELAESWGPVAGQWEVKKNRIGFWIAGGTKSTAGVNVVAAIQHSAGPDEATDDEGNVTTTTTTTTMEPCSGRCRWIWSDADQIWELDENTCGTGAATTTTTTGDPATTTTADPCNCGTTTTTTTPDPGTTTTTTTPDPGDCACTYPAWCGSVDGECTYTNCASGYVPTVVTCTTTTTCDCNTTTTTPNCNDCCQWTCTVDGWVRTSNACPSGCECTEPADSCVHCVSAGGGTGVSCPDCTGECTWIWYDDLGWYYVNDNCAAGTCHGCDCVRPSFTGEHCTYYRTPCQSPEPPEPCGHCYEGSTTTTTTTSVPGDCTGDCKWQWETDVWTLTEPNCQAGCTCLEPAYLGLAACEVTWTRCGPSFTTTTTTTTTTTADPGCCIPGIACTYQFNYGTRLFELISDTCGVGCDCPAVINQCLPCQDSYTGGTGWIVNLPCGRFNSKVSYIDGGPGSTICSAEDCSTTNCDDFFGAGEPAWPATDSSYFYTCGGGDCFGGPTTTTTTTPAPGACCDPVTHTCYASGTYTQAECEGLGNTFHSGLDCIDIIC